MESNTAFIDTSYLISFFDTQDINHLKAQNLSIHLVNIQILFISNLIYLETTTVLSQKLGKTKLKEALSLMQVFEPKELFLTATLNQKTKEAFLSEEKKDISFVDISSCILMKEFKIPHIITFDKHFKKLEKKYKFTTIQ